MNSLVATQQSAVAYQGITEGLFNRFVEFIDARPKTVETYSRALRQFFRFLSLFPSVSHSSISSGQPLLTLQTRRPLRTGGSRGSLGSVGTGSLLDLTGSTLRS